MSTTQLLRPRQVAERLGVSRATLYRMMRAAGAGPLPFPRPFKLSPQCVVFRASEVDEWVEIKRLLGI